MSEQTDELLASLDEQLTYTDKEGVVLKIALFATVYVEDTYTPEVRDAIVACCEDYTRLCGDHLRWAFHPDTRLMERFGEGKASSPRAWLTELPDDDSFFLRFHSGKWDRGAAPFSMTAMGHPRRTFKELGYVRFSFPLTWLTQQPSALPDLLLKVCQRLKPVSGYGGIGINECVDNNIRHRYFPIVYEVAQRFPGLEPDYPHFHSIYLVKGEGGIKSVNWLTVLGDRLLARLGGVDSVEVALAALDPRFITRRFDGGVMIQAGPHPELGAADQDDWPVLYVKLAKYLKPLRVPVNALQHRVSGQHFDLPNTEAWLRRFDDR